MKVPILTVMCFLNRKDSIYAIIGAGSRKKYLRKTAGGSYVPHKVFQFGSGGCWFFFSTALLNTGCLFDFNFLAKDKVDVKKTKNKTLGSVTAFFFLHFLLLLPPLDLHSRPNTTSFRRPFFRDYFHV